VTGTTSAFILLGFDIGHAVLSILNFKPSVITIVVATINGSPDPRTVATYSSLEQLAALSRIRSNRLDIEISNINRSVGVIGEELMRLAQESVPVIVDIGGGMRLLVLETLLAILSLPKWLQDLVKVVAYFEGTNRYVELDYKDLMKIIRAYKLHRESAEELTYIDKKILEILDKKRKASLKEIHEELIRQGITTSKQNVNRILTKLEDKGYIRKIERGIYVKAIL